MVSLFGTTCLTVILLSHLPWFHPLASEILDHYWILDSTSPVPTQGGCYPLLWMMIIHGWMRHGSVTKSQNPKDNLLSGVIHLSEPLSSRQPIQPKKMLVQRFRWSRKLWKSWWLKACIQKLVFWLQKCLDFYGDYIYSIY